MFDLNEAIARWRTTQSAQPGVRRTDLDELEDHLRESIRELVQAGLSEEEAFTVALRRLGGPAELGEEFAIADPRQRRGVRVRWMLAGALAWLLVWQLGEIVANVGAGAFGFLTDGGMDGIAIGGIGWLANALRLGVLVLGAILVWRLATTDRAAGRLFRLSGTVVIVAALLVVVFVMASRELSVAFLVRGVPKAAFVQFAVFSRFFAMGLMLALPMLMVWGLWRLVRS